ncbi:MAG TPA: acetate kinase [Gemmataceae bacterium]|jgi:acetate kinase|nr:acetate kinase [Gemmataceae bacterium]
MKVVVINTGSSSLKFSLIESDGERLLQDGQADWASPPARLTVRRPGREPDVRDLPEAGHGAAVRAVLGHLAGDPDGPVAAVGHRVVHGGPHYTAGVRVTPQVKADLAALTDLAPLHVPINLEGIAAAESAWPGVPQVAVFDTAFHATLPPAARTYALPHAWTADWGLRRYGFHGLSHAYCAGRAAEMLGRPAAGLRLVICHLGQGCSLSAVRDGRSVDTSMGFTPLDGVVMGTRSGAVDPGLLLFVLRHKGLSAEDVDRALNHEAGLLGVSGVSGDMRKVLEAARQGHAGARLALDVYAHRLRQTVGAFAATLGGLDALVFTAGVGEHSPDVRAAACLGLEFLGVELDAAANSGCRPDADVAVASARVRVLVIATREDLTVVRETVRVLGQG